jgi:hypothetical protein
MRVTYFALCATALVGPVVASLSLGESSASSPLSRRFTDKARVRTGPEGQISSINAHKKLKEYGQASMKEICYRNLYADLSESTPSRRTEKVPRD